MLNQSFGLVRSGARQGHGVAVDTPGEAHQVKPISIDAADMRLRNHNWNDLTVLEQGCVAAASALANDSSHIPLIASEIISYLGYSRVPNHPEPEFSI